METSAGAGTVPIRQEAAVSAHEPDARPWTDATDATDAEPLPADGILSEDGGTVVGVFASPRGTSRGNGFRELPFATLTEALKQAKKTGRPVYACDEGTGYAEVLTIDEKLDGVSLYGGYDCTTWTRRPGARTLVHAAAQTALKLSGLVSGIVIEAFEVQAANATAPAASSLAVIVDHSANVVFRDVRIQAGDGGDGAPGTDGAKGDDGPTTGSAQLGTPALCPGVLKIQAGGGWSSESVCGSHGGTGGQATLGGLGLKSSAGTPQSNVVKPGFDNGAGSDATGGVLAANGSDGLPGAPGVVSEASGRFSQSGYTAAPPGQDGADGWPGQGGGGGGASNGSGDCIGASGGAGGIGGCGGRHGKGGASGGASVALLTWASAVSLDACELVAGRGGSGGNGGIGGSGGIGGDGSIGGSGFYGPDSGIPVAWPGGQGGQGGNGGSGGPGAGGNGGPSYLMVYQGSAPVIANTKLVRGVGGRHGTGGRVGNDAPAADGIDGEVAVQFLVQ